MRKKIFLIAFAVAIASIFVWIAHPAGKQKAAGIFVVRVIRSSGVFPAPDPSFAVQVDVGENVSFHITSIQSGQKLVSDNAGPATGPWAMMWDPVGRLWVHSEQMGGFIWYPTRKGIWRKINDPRVGPDCLPDVFQGPFVEPLVSVKDDLSEGMRKFHANLAGSRGGTTPKEPGVIDRIVKDRIADAEAGKDPAILTRSDSLIRKCHKKADLLGTELLEPLYSDGDVRDRRKLLAQFAVCVMIPMRDLVLARRVFPQTGSEEYDSVFFYNSLNVQCPTELFLPEGSAERAFFVAGPAPDSTPWGLTVQVLGRHESYLRFSSDNEGETKPGAK